MLSCVCNSYWRNLVWKQVCRHRCVSTHSIKTQRMKSWLDLGQKKNNHYCWRESDVALLRIIYSTVITINRCLKARSLLVIITAVIKTLLIHFCISNYTLKGYTEVWNLIYCVANLLLCNTLMHRSITEFKYSILSTYLGIIYYFIIKHICQRARSLKSWICGVELKITLNPPLPPNI